MATILTAELGHSYVSLVCVCVRVHACVCVCGKVVARIVWQQLTEQLLPKLQ